MIPVEPGPGPASGRQPSAATEAAMKVWGCRESSTKAFLSWCLEHHDIGSAAYWTDEGCPVAVEVAREVGAAALDEMAELCIGCDHVTALAWCGICDQWRAALRARAAEIDEMISTSHQMRGEQ